jgi:hypothetical protein
VRHLKRYSGLNWEWASRASSKEWSLCYNLDTYHIPVRIATNLELHTGTERECRDCVVLVRPWRNSPWSYGYRYMHSEFASWKTRQGSVYSVTLDSFEVANQYLVQYRILNNVGASS